MRLTCGCRERGERPPTVRTREAVQVGYHLYSVTYLSRALKVGYRGREAELLSYPVGIGRQEVTGGKSGRKPATSAEGRKPATSAAGLRRRHSVQESMEGRLSTISTISAPIDNLNNLGAHRQSRQSRRPSTISTISARASPTLCLGTFT